MFYKMINTARDKWYSSDDCTARPIVEYVISVGKMRDAQVEAIKTYLFLKIACYNKPLTTLFTSGAFNNIDLNEVELSLSVRTFLASNPAATALLEYASIKMIQENKSPQSWKML